MPTVLILEDDAANRNALSAVLLMKGYRVLEAATARSAVDDCRQHQGPVDLFISDLKLPDGSGTEVALTIHRLRPNMPILFISGIPMTYWHQRDVFNFKRI